YVQWSAEPIPSELPAKLGRPLARFTSGLDLVDLQTFPAPGHLDVRLCWSKETSAVAPAAVVVEATDANGQSYGRQEDAVGTVYYPPPFWRAGNITVQHVSLPLSTLGRAPRQLRLGLA